MFDQLARPRFSGIRRSGRSVWASSDFSFRACWASGYDTIEDILNNHLALSVLTAGAVPESVCALVLSLGSGTSGGTLAPMFMISAAIGSVVCHRCGSASSRARIFRRKRLPLVAMGALLGASSRATFTFMFCAFETTRDFHAVLPLLLVCVLADAVAYTLLPNSIMTEKFAQTRHARAG